MTAAAIKGTYSDYRRVKGRKVLQLIVEVPLEQAPQVHDAFGEPLTDGSTWVAVARLDPEKADETPVEQKPAEDKHRLSRQAAMLCDQPIFWSFLIEKIAMPDESEPTDASWAAYIVRDWCKVKSRSQFDSSEMAAKRWRDLHAEFEAWKITA